MEFLKSGSLLPDRKNVREKEFPHRRATNFYESERFYGLGDRGGDCDRVPAGAFASRISTRWATTRSRAIRERMQLAIDTALGLIDKARGAARKVGVRSPRRIERV
jgi:hypothetical protein